MTRFTASARQRGFTLVELLVVMGLIVTLAAVAMVVTPAIMDRDRSVDAVNQLEQWLQISRARAQRDGLPRGVRLIVNGSAQVTEVQYIESPPVFLPNSDPPFPNGMIGTVGTASAQPHPLSPRVEFTYTTGNGGAIASRKCEIRGLTTDQRDQVMAAVGTNQLPLLWLPVLGTWHRMQSIKQSFADGVEVSLYPDVSTPSTPTAPGSYPDAQLGASTSYRTYQFGIYGPPRPLLGEPAMQLPNRTCIDMSLGVSSPSAIAANQDFDILFAPNGQLTPTGSTGTAGHVFLWIRDYRKVPSFAPTQNANGTFTYDLAKFEQGGEMMIVAIKARGAIGIAPVTWPVSNAPTDTTTPSPTGTGQTGTFDPYSLARKAVAGP